MSSFFNFSVDQLYANDVTVIPHIAPLRNASATRPPQHVPDYQNGGLLRVTLMHPINEAAQERTASRKKNAILI